MLCLHLGQLVRPATRWMNLTRPQGRPRTMHVLQISGRAPTACSRTLRRGASSEFRLGPAGEHGAIILAKGVQADAGLSMVGFLGILAPGTRTGPVSDV